MSNYNNSYVKFIKGSLAAFNKLSHKDSSTLYFITDKETGELNLYLGETLISSSNVKPEQLSLNELLDVTLGDSISTGSILTFNGSEWIDTSLETFKTWLDIPSMPEVMQPASAEKDGASGLVPIPTAGLQNNFLRADGSWTDIVPIITSEVEKVVDGAPEAFDTLKEIANWIADDNSGATTLVTRVGTLEGLVNDNSDEISSLKETSGLLVTNVGNLTTTVGELQKAVNDLATGGNVDLSGYVTTTQFVTVVGDLKNLNNYSEENSTNIVNEINEINERLTWQTLDEN